jgi:DNA (cytosine-5)-methyltransferase 1
MNYTGNSKGDSPGRAGTQVGEMKKLSLFSGIGGDDLASDAAGIETVCFVERDKFCQQVLRKHWPGIPIIEDVRDVTKEKIIEYTVSQSRQKNTEARLGVVRNVLSEARRHEDTNGTISSSGAGIDIISGGFPCQPHSVAGKRKGSGDERDLWPEFRRIIGVFKPRWVVGENVPGLYASDGGLFFNGIVCDLAALGYSVGWCTYGAVDVGAWHKRDRVFIVAYTGYQHINVQQRAIRAELKGSRQDVPDTTEPGLEGAKPEGLSCTGGLPAQCGAISDTQCQQFNGSGRTRGRQPELTDSSQWQPESRLGRMVDGISYWSHEPDGIPRVATGIKDRVNRLKGLGNAVVPQQIYLVYKAIVEAER